MKKFSEILKSRQEAKGENGFSLLEMVVAMGILIVLTVGGILAYNGITDSARQASLDSAAKSVYTGIIAAESDSDPLTNESTVIAEFTNSSGKSNIVVTPTRDGGNLTVTAENADWADKSGVAGYVAPAVTPAE